MSHEFKVAMIFQDVDALEQAATELKAVFHRGQTSYTMYQGQKPCDHAISVPGVRYQVGLRKTAEGFQPVWDTYGLGDGSRHDGQKLVERFGPKMEALKQRYGVVRAERLAKKKGLRTRRKVKTDGVIRLVMA